MDTTLITPDKDELCAGISIANLMRSRANTFPPFLGDKQCFAVAVALANIHKANNSPVDEFMHDLFIWGFLMGVRARDEGRLGP